MPATVRPGVREGRTDAGRDSPTALVRPGHYRPGRQARGSFGWRTLPAGGSSRSGWPLWTQQKGLVLLANSSGEPAQRMVVQFRSPVPVSKVRSLRSGEVNFKAKPQGEFELALPLLLRTPRPAPRPPVPTQPRRQLVRKPKPNPRPPRRRLRYPPRRQKTLRPPLRPGNHPRRSPPPLHHPDPRPRNAAQWCRLPACIRAPPDAPRPSPIALSAPHPSSSL